MKKYIITEQQLSLILEAADKLPQKGEYKDVADLSYDDFRKAIEADQNKDPKAGGLDNKDYAIGQMASNRTEFYMDKAQNSLDKIAGKFNKSIYTSAYHLKSNDDVLDDAERLGSIVLGLMYFLFKENVIQKQYTPKDVRYQYDKAYKYLKNNNLAEIKALTQMSVISQWSTAVNPNETTESIASTQNGSIQIHIDIDSKKTKYVKFNFIDNSSLQYFYDKFLKTGDNLKKIQAALAAPVKPMVQTGSLIFNF
jgi:hypothetical protein